MERCRSCGATIVWGTTSTGTPVPLDATDDGQLVEVDDSPLAVIPQLFAGPAPIVRHIKARARGPRSHFATCPDAFRWRKKKEPKPTRGASTCS